jgi:hypothetical protein
VAPIGKHDELIASFRRQQRSMDLAAAIVLVGAVASIAGRVTFGRTWPSTALNASWLVLAAGVALWAATDRARRAFRRGPRHRGVLVARGATLFELRTPSGSLWITGPHVEHAPLPRLFSLGHAPNEVTVVGPVRATSEVPAELAGSGDYRGGATFEMIEGTLERPAWIFGAGRAPAGAPPLGPGDARSRLPAPPRERRPTT